MMVLGQYWSFLDGTGSVEGGAGQYLVVLGQYGAVMGGFWRDWVSMKRNWLIHDNIGAVEGDSG